MAIKRLGRPRIESSRRRRPWVKWFPADWLSDQAVRLCSPSTRGIWIELLMLIYQADERGGGDGSITRTKEQFAILCGCTVSQFNHALKELESNCVAEIQSSNMPVDKSGNGEDKKSFVPLLSRFVPESVEVFVTVTSRRAQRETKARNYERLRKRKQRDS